MKKLLAVIALVAAVVTPVVAGDAVSKSDAHADVCDHAALTSGGACNQPNCKCKSFNQRPGYYGCWCGHQRTSHTK